MSIADGRKIAIRFTQPLTGEISGNETKFTVSFDEYDMVPEGTLSRTTRPVTGIEHFVTLNDDVDLSNGSFKNTEYSKSGICLSKKEAE